VLQGVVLARRSVRGRRERAPKRVPHLPLPAARAERGRRRVAQPAPTHIMIAMPSPCAADLRFDHVRSRRRRRVPGRGLLVLWTSQPGGPRRRPPCFGDCHVCVAACADIFDAEVGIEGPRGGVDGPVAIAVLVPCQATSASTGCRRPAFGGTSFGSTRGAFCDTDRCASAGRVTPIMYGLELTEAVK
jgi:hypothetical protein